MAYEKGMSIQYDHATKTLTIHFRGETHEERMNVRNDDSVRQYGESFCRRRGWQDDELSRLR